MAHFARIDKNNIVQSIHIIDDVHLLNEHGVEEEDFGIVYLNNVHGVGFTWVQTSPDRSFRKNSAGVGNTYDSTRDAFIPAQPYPSWTLNETTCRWDYPVAYPDDGKHYVWDEAITNWKEIT